MCKLFEIQLLIFQIYISPPSVPAPALSQTMKKWANLALYLEVCVGGLNLTSHKTATGSGTLAGPQTLGRFIKNGDNDNVMTLLG